MEKEKQLLLLCRQLIEQSINWDDSSIWSNDDFEQLSKLIFEKTKVQLSISTLKRIWGKVKYESFPATATLNALAQFIDYESWRDFRLRKSIIDNADLIPEFIIPVPSTPKNHKRYSYKYIWMIGGFLLGLVFLIKSEKPTNIDTTKVKFSGTKITDDLPNSVVFQYDASAFNSDSVFIQQSWDPTHREQVAVGGKQYTSIYYHPGYFLAKLVVDNAIKKETVVFIKTKGWKGIIDKLPVPIYLSAKEINGSGYMGISDNVLQQKIGSPVFNNIWVKFSNVREYQGIDAGNFDLETTLRNTSTTGQSVCGKTNLVILGIGRAIVIPLVSKGCISDIGLLTGENWISGKDHDLKAFGCDFTHFQNLKCSVKNHRFKVYLNDKQIFDANQKQSIGRIVGIRFEFEGSGQVKHVKLETPGVPVYEENFDN